MGIKWFASFLKTYPRPILQQTSVRDQYLVMDGNELLYELYFEVDKIGKGNYASYRKHIESFFETLKRHEIRPVVVFDGFKFDEHEGTYLARRERKLGDMARMFTDPRSRSQIKPSLCELLFKQTLNDLEIPWAVGVGDTDQDTAAIANILDAPVLATDTIYCALSVNQGFIPYYTFKWNQHGWGRGQQGVQAAIFRTASFAAQFGIDRNCIPFLAVLFSNTVLFKFDDFEQFRQSTVEKVRIPQRMFQLRSRNFRRPNSIENCLVWLSNNYTEDDRLRGEMVRDLPGRNKEEISGTILDFVLSCRSPRAQRKVIEKIRNAFPEPRIRNFLDDDSMFHPSDPVMQNENLQEALQMSMAQNFPSWAMRMLLHQVSGENLVRFVPLVLTNPREFDSPLTISESVRHRSYQALLSDDRESLIVVEYQQQGMRYVENPPQDIERPPHVLGPFGRAFASTDDENILDQRRKYILDTLIDPVDDAATDKFMHATEELPSGMRLTIGISIYWIKGENPPQDAVKALAFQFTILQQQQQGNKDLVSLTKQKLEDQLPIRTRSQRLPDAQVLYWSGQWQSCMKHAIDLNQILNFPFPEPQIARCFEGSLFELAYTCCLAGFELSNVLENNHHRYQLFCAALGI